MLKFLYKVNTNQNNELVNVINSGLKDSKEEIKKMPKEEKETEKPDNIVKLVEEILKFNKQKQEGQGMKILTPSSEKLKNEVRQLLYSLYHSKNITKQVHNNLIKCT